MNPNGLPDELARPAPRSEPSTKAEEDRQYADFERELATLINQHSLENTSNTPDLILARYLVACLRAWNYGTGERELWYGHSHQPGRSAS